MSPVHNHYKSIDPYTNETPINIQSEGVCRRRACACLAHHKCHAFTYGITLPTAPDGFAWAAQNSSTFWSSSVAQLTAFPIASGTITPGNDYDQSNSITNQNYELKIGAFSVSDDSERFYLITSQTISTSAQFYTTDVFTSFDPNHGSSFDVTRTSSIELAGSGAVALGNSSSTTNTMSLTLNPLEALATPRNPWAGDSVFLAGNDIDFDFLTLTGTVSMSYRLEATGPDAGGVVVGSSFDSAYVSTTRALSYTRYTLVAIPEPTTALLGGLGMLTLFRRRRNA